MTFFVYRTLKYFRLPNIEKCSVFAKTKSDWKTSESKNHKISLG